VDLDISSYLSKAIETYKSPSQIARKVTESWARDNLYCPRCGLHLHPYKDNTEVYDFYCSHRSKRLLLLSYDKDDFQLKSMKSFPRNRFPNRIIGAEYYTTIRSLELGAFPSLILLHYSLREKEVKDGLFIHRLSFNRNNIVRRKALSQLAIRNNWVGSEIILDAVPDLGKIPMISDSEILPKEEVMYRWAAVESILKGDLERRSWIGDMLLVIDRLPSTFSLEDAYSFQHFFERNHPGNRHIKEKIRQQLQILRDRGYLRFVGRGRYQKDTALSPQVLP
jgi:type II restriction enzyme